MADDKKDDQIETPEQPSVGTYHEPSIADPIVSGGKMLGHAVQAFLGTMNAPGGTSSAQAPKQIPQPSAPQEPAPSAPGISAQPAPQPMPQLVPPAAKAAPTDEEQPEDQTEPTPAPAPTLEIPGAAPRLTPGQQFLQEDQMWQRDLANGHVQPKTYHDLFAKNDDGSDRGTLSKLGMMFGMFASGVGSGLTHQPNQMLEMMNNEIKRDYDAQVQSKSNALNYSRVAAEIGKTGAETQGLLYQNEGYRRELAQQLAGRAEFNRELQRVQALPDGSDAKRNGFMALGMMSRALDQKAQNTADMIDAQFNMNQQMFGGQPSAGGAPDEAAFQQRNRALMMSGPQAKDLGQYEQERHFAGVPQQASTPISQDDRNRVEKMNVLDNKVQDVLNFAVQHRGTVDPSIRKQAAQKAHELTAFYNQSVDSLGMTEGRLNWLDEQVKKNPTSVIRQVLGNNAALREIRDSNRGRRDILMQKYGIPSYPKAAAPQGGASEGMTGKSKSGRPIIFKNGQWMYQ
jgi:hypothetical protein